MDPSHKHNISPENKLIHAPLLSASECGWHIAVVEFYFGVRKISVMRVNVYSRNVSI